MGRGQVDGRRIVLVEPFGRGGGVDVIASELAAQCGRVLGVSVVVDNRSGDGATAAPAFVAAARADGRTLLISTSAHAYSAALSEGLAYDPIADFVAIAPVTSQAYVLVASGGSEIGSLADLVRVAAARQLAFASAGTGTGTHVGVAQLNVDLGICADHVPARPADGISATIARVAAGELDYALSPISIARPHLAAGTLTALGVSAAQRSPLLPELPTLAEAGAVGFDFAIWYGVWGPAATPPSRVAQLAAAIAEALRASQPSHGLTSTVRSRCI